jgi:hypothetical protein
MRVEGGGYRRLRALAQRIEVDAKEVRIRGSKSVLLRTLVAASSAKSAMFGVPSSVPKWRGYDWRSRVAAYYGKYTDWLNGQSSDVGQPTRQILSASKEADA